MNAVVLRRFIPAIYGVAMLIGFLVNDTAGLIVVIVAGLLSALAWQLLGRMNRQAHGARRQRDS